MNGVNGRFTPFSCRAEGYKPVGMRRMLLSLLLLIPVAVSAAGMEPAMPAPPPDRMVLAPDAEAQWVPFTLTPGNQIQFRMAVDGRPASAILDTGFSLSVISRRWVDAAGIKVGGATRGVGIGGSVPMGLINGRALTIGGLTRYGGRLGVVDLPRGATGGAETIDAVIGGDLLRRYALDIDFPNHRFRLLPSGRLPFTGMSAPLTMALGDQFYVSEISVDGVRVRPMIIDTGDGATLTLSSEALRGAGIARAATTTTISYGMAAPVTVELTTLPAIRIGEAILRDAETKIEPNSAFSAQMGAAGRIGMGFLQRYRVLLDPGAGRMVLAPAVDTDRPQVRSTSGLLFSVDSDRLRVVHVMRASPAAAGGWKIGEQICSVDGVAITAAYLNDPISGWSVGQPGRVVRLGLCNGGMRSLTLERFY